MCPADHQVDDRVELLSLLEVGAGGSGSLTVLGADGTETRASFAQIWEQAGQVSAGLRPRVPFGATVGAVLGSSIACVTAVVGVLRGGWTLASFPNPARGMSEGEYVAQLAALCRLAGASTLLLDEAWPSLPAPVPVRSYADVVAGRAPGVEEAPGGRLIQFTSGSTASPKGIVLPLDRVGANVRSMMRTPGGGQPGDLACSWLPLSHDMGLIGALFSAWACRGDLVLIDPAAFIADPSIWMRTCASSGATHTMGPNFGYGIAARLSRNVSEGSLDALRVCIVGAEPVRAKTLRDFAAAMAPLGFDEHALLPGYGLAEATLAVTSQRIGAPWRSASVDPEALGAGSWRERPDGTELVAAGRPLPGMRVRLDPTGPEVAEIQISGASVMEGYLGAPSLPDGGWLSTGDLGVVVDDELYVTGRLDDLLFIGGRNFYAHHLEQAAGVHPSLRGGACIAVQRDDGRYAIVAERRAGVPAAKLTPVRRWVARELTRRFGAAPADVVVIEPGTLPMTPSGKLARRAAESAYERGVFEGG